MRRACKLSLKFLTKSKQDKINALLQAYRGAVNFYIKSLWKTQGKLDKTTLARLSNTRLSERYKSQALKQAIEMIVSTRKSAKALGKFASCPVFNGCAILDTKFVTIEKGEKSFDIIVRLSTLKKGAKITIPTKSTAILNKWLSKPNAKLIQGCALSENKLIVWVEIPKVVLSETGYVPQELLGVDIGVNKVLVDSNGNKYGLDFITLRKKIQSKTKGSQAYKDSLKERDNYLDKVVNSLPWGAFKVLGVEQLKDLKKGKSKKRGKGFRKAMIPWTYRRVIKRLQEKAEENRVLFVFVEPAYTSQTCPKCSAVLSKNRKGELFKCSICSYSNDSDIVGAMNVFARTLRLVGSVESPILKRTLKEQSI